MSQVRDTLPSVANTFDLTRIVDELRRRGKGPTAADVDQWRSVLADPLARFALRTLAGDTVDRMADLFDEEREQVTVVARAIAEFSGRGWAPSFALPLDALRRALEAHDQGASCEQVEGMLETGWTASGTLDRLAVRVGALGAADDDLRTIAQHRARLVEKAWEHHCDGKFEASIPILLAQVDGITHDATTSPQDPKGRSFFSLQSGRQAEVVDDETLAGINEALPIVRQWFSAEYPTTADGGTPNRHGVLHGRELTYDTRINSTKCLVLLLAVWEWASRKLTAEAERRSSDRSAAHAGSDEVDENGWRLDRRGFTDTRLALKNLDLAQTMYHRLHGRFGTIDELTTDSVAKMLLQDTAGLEAQVQDDGWWACRQSASGWTFALGRTTTSGPWYFDDADQPSAPPPATGWRLQDDGHWSGDCYW
jgi:hypothetical protein